MKIEHEKTLELISKSTLLSRAFQFFCTYNRGLNNPYHNLNHTLDLIGLVDACCGNITDEHHERLMLLAMFHDFNHSAGTTDDKTNVQASIWGLKEFLATQGMPLSMEDEEILEDTIYPYSGNAKTEDGKLLRACDCLQWALDDVVTQCIYGLAKENRIKDINSAISQYIEFVRTELKPQIDAVPMLSVLYNGEFETFENRLNTLKQIYSK